MGIERVEPMSFSGQLPRKLEKGAWGRRRNHLRKYDHVIASMKDRPQAEDFAHGTIDDVSGKYRKKIYVSLDFLSVTALQSLLILFSCHLIASRLFLI